MMRSPGKIFSWTINELFHYFKAQMLEIHFRCKDLLWLLNIQHIGMMDFGPNLCILRTKGQVPILQNKMTPPVIFLLQMLFYD